MSRMPASVEISIKLVSVCLSTWTHASVCTVIVLANFQPFAVMFQFTTSMCVREGVSESLSKWETKEIADR